MRTPGPWTWDEQDGYVIGPPGEGVVAFDVGYDEDGRLLAAAPELLEALEMFLEAESTPGDMTTEAIKAHAAVAKARGIATAPPAEAEGASR